MAKIYCGAQDPPPKSYKRGTMKQCIDKNQVRYYGVKRIDQNLYLKHVQNKGQPDKVKLRTKAAGLQGKANNLLKKYNKAKKESEKMKLKKEYNDIVKQYNDINKKIRQMSRSKSKGSRKRSKRRLSKKSY